MPPQTPSAPAVPATAPINVVLVDALAAPQANGAGHLLEDGGPYISASAAVIAAIIAGTIAWRGISKARESVFEQLKAQRDNLILQLDTQREIAAKASRASVISANRQKWIDGIRDDLAEFIAADFVLLDDVDTDEEGMSDSEKTSYHARIAEATLTRRLMQRRIQLRLNPQKDSHKALYKAVRDLVPATGKDHVRARLRLVSTAQKFLRQEWLRVKSEAGEWDKINSSGPSLS